MSMQFSIPEHTLPGNVLEKCSNRGYYKASEDLQVSGRNLHCTQCR